jgi:HemY protein
MKALLASLALLVLAALGTQLVLDEPGYALLAYGSTSVEMSLFVFVLLGLIAFLLLYIGLSSMLRALQMPTAIRRRTRLHRRQKARDGLAKGLTALAEGRWRDAEKSLVRSARHSSVPLLHHLAAAQAAQMQGDDDLAELYLSRADHCEPTSPLAVALARAEAAAAARDFEGALATLRRMDERVARGGYASVLRARVLARMQAWRELLEILPQLRGRHELPPEELEELTREAVRGSLDSAARDGDLAALQTVWARLDKADRANPTFVASYGAALCTLREPDKAEAAIRGALERHWDDELARLYGVIEHSEPARALKHAEGWLKSHGDSAALLLSLGRLCQQAQLWGKARLYLESSLGQGPSPETYRELAQLLERIGEPARAEECYRKGLRLAVEGVAEPLDSHPEGKQRAVKEAQAPTTEIYPV